MLLLKQMKGFSYEELHFHLMDSETFRTFCRFGVMEEVPGRSTLAENIKKVRAETLEQINREMLAHAKVVQATPLAPDHFREPMKSRMDQQIIDDLIKAATAVRENAYAPYSGFRVGAAVLTEGGQVFSGCNVESVSYSPTICAERNAVSTAVAAGARRVVAVALVAGADTPASPCGVCRQVLAEFAGPDAVVVSEHPKTGERRSWTVGGLLPEGFTFDGPARR